MHKLNTFSADYQWIFYVCFEVSTIDATLSIFSLIDHLFSFNCLLSGKSFFTTMRTQLECKKCLHATCSATSRNYLKKKINVNKSANDTDKVLQSFQWKWLAFMSEKKTGDSWHDSTVLNTREWANNELGDCKITWM